ncbi:unnamed protein product [Clonostachys solani]|uniref:Uncharacterized protein n=1 Tax=Clonostachys solani TaxID=160281 RepID=A0A9N9Z425_9HYPO|nr:unnamed protein product [Clonostachys solani]
MASSTSQENPDLYNVSNIDGTKLDTVGVCWAFTGLAASFLITRIIARVRWDKEMFGHDFWCIGGLIAMNSIDGEAFPYATAQQWRDAKFWQLLSLCVGALSASLPKLAIATFLVRLLRPSIWNQWFMLWMAIWSLLSQSTLSIAMMFQCMPIESFIIYTVVKAQIEQWHGGLRIGVFYGTQQHPTPAISILTEAKQTFTQ